MITLRSKHQSASFFTVLVPVLLKNDEPLMTKKKVKLRLTKTNSEKGRQKTGEE